MSVFDAYECLHSCMQTHYMHVWNLRMPQRTSAPLDQLPCGNWGQNLGSFPGIASDNHWAISSAPISHLRVINYIHTYSECSWCLRKDDNLATWTRNYIHEKKNSNGTMSNDITRIRCTFILMTPWTDIVSNQIRKWNLHVLYWLKKTFPND